MAEGDEIAFLHLAARELWTRLLPDRPSCEQLADWVDEAYRHVADRDAAGACALFGRTWDVVRSRLPPDATSPDAVDERCPVEVPFAEWSDDYAMELVNAAQTDSAHADLGDRYCAEWVARFTDASPGLQVDIRRFWSMLLLRSGRKQEAADLVRELPVRWPDVLWGYIELFDAYLADPPERSPLERDLAAAKRALDQAYGLFGRDDLKIGFLDERREMLDELARRGGGASRG